MPSVFALSVVVFGVFGAALTKPLAARARCFPDFNADVVLIEGGNGPVTPTGLGFLPDVSWSIVREFSSVGQTGYSVRDFSQPMLALTRNFNDSLTLKPFEDGTFFDSQIFIMDCDNCTLTADAGCFIRFFSDLRLCVTQTGKDLNVTRCDDSDEGVHRGQTFSFSGQ